MRRLFPGVGMQKIFFLMVVLSSFVGAGLERQVVREKLKEALHLDRLLVFDVSLQLIEYNPLLEWLESQGVVEEVENYRVRFGAGKDGRAFIMECDYDDYVRRDFWILHHCEAQNVYQQELTPSEMERDFGRVPALLLNPSFQLMMI